MAQNKLTPAQEKFIEKFLGNPSETETTTISNRFFGGSAVVSLKFAALYNFIMRVESAMQKGDSELKKIHPELKMSNAVMNFDRARMTALALDPSAYMTLLD